ncbi:fumarylacetoacetate hydrolase family protein [Actinopolymorpha alba]|uniref:fumarylacetoacetate hydrolase family protein n=1 Tax=Actinopolymorpha alba TaxID=533267 RepID=UPI00035FDCE5|nr:fumarylacetoacetate hydrolase family protein [Actinopolymorpha alba]
MEIVRYADRTDRAVRVGVRREGRVVPLAGVSDIASLLRLPLTEIRQRVEAAGAVAGEAGLDETAVLLLPPLDGRTEVWASGVTYERSKEARVEESTEKSVYEKVYDAERPELFFKSVAWRVVTHGEPIGIRADSGLDVPEPELGVVANTAGEIVGYVVCNDVSSRVIEGENPLYLPQAKVYAGSCALSAGIRLAWEVEDARALDIRLTVVRDGQPVWKGETSTARMRRTLPELVGYLFRGDSFPDGAFLATGTGIIPELSFTLAAGDRVDIEIAAVGVLSNPVVVGKEPLGWLVDALSDPFAREAAR